MFVVYLYYNKQIIMEGILKVRLWSMFDKGDKVNILKVYESCPFTGEKYDKKSYKIRKGSFTYACNEDQIQIIN